jgi:cell division septation protein DedD
LSLSPDAAPARRPEPTRTASAPAAAAPAPAAASHSGGYTVQVSAQRSEAEAQAAFRTLQGKYPSQLGGRQPIIKRADLGSKGVYYRALVGPFASSGEATQLCQSLKAAGGSCLIQRN